MAKKAKTKDQAPVPSVLAFSRKIEPSDGLMQAGLWENQDKPQAWQNIEIYDKRNRGVKSHYGVDEKEKRQHNPVWGDDATLPHELDTLKVTFTIKFLGNLDQATANDEPEFLIKLRHSYSNYKQDIGLEPLAKRYAQNLANARYLWRNRIGAEGVVVKVINTENPTQSWKFEDAQKISLHDFEVQNTKIDELAKLIANSFETGEYLLLKVEAFAKVGLGQRVFPSQEMRDKDDEKNSKTKGKSKFLYEIKTLQGNCAGLHSEKIGNAIRTIDTWYVAKEELPFKPAIAIEPYGSVPTQGDAYRTSETDLYSLMAKWINQEDISIEEQHFVVANLIRGGVFGGKD